MDVIYRISSNEVDFIGTIPTGSPGRPYDPNNFAELTDPPLTDGSTFKPKRVLGYAKINDSGTIRNATQEEIDTFAAAEIDDNNQIEADTAKVYFQNNPQFRRIMTAHTDILIEFEINKYRKWFRDFEEQMSLATSLANLQTRMAALCAANPMPDRELSQMRTQIINRISKDD